MGVAPRRRLGPDADSDVSGLVAEGACVCSSRDQHAESDSDSVLACLALWWPPSALGLTTSCSSCRLRGKMRCALRLSARARGRRAALQRVSWRLAVARHQPRRGATWGGMLFAELGSGWANLRATSANAHVRLIRADLVRYAVLWASCSGGTHAFFPLEQLTSHSRLH